MPRFSTLRRLQFHCICIVLLLRLGAEFVGLQRRVCCFGRARGLKMLVFPSLPEVGRNYKASVSGKACNVEFLSST
jgi:hypothetical protein